MRPIIGIIGSGDNACKKSMYEFALELGDRLVSEGYRIVSGGKGGVMEAVSNGGMNSENYFEGSIICILPGLHKTSANKFCDIAIPTGFGLNRNTVIINTADILIAIGGGSGTMSEISFAWQYGKKVLCVTNFGGWSEELAGKNLDNRNENLLIPVSDIDEIIETLRSFI
ncbi:MAG: TIGR00725 family protein [Bacteroidales bacterium]|nr:TIGR00725 family protein [Bacteroidales bacterium]